MTDATDAERAAKIAEFTGSQDAIEKMVETMFPGFKTHLVFMRDVMKMTDPDDLRAHLLGMYDAFLMGEGHIEKFPTESFDTRN